jgi:plastocyanin
MIARTMLSLVAAALIGACGGGEDTAEDQATTPATTPGTTTSAADVTMQDNFFEPASVEAASGDSLTVANEGSALHSFTINQSDVDVDVQPGGSEEVSISVDPGDHSFVCKYHQGMSGTLTVT